MGSIHHLHPLELSNEYVYIALIGFEIAKKVCVIIFFNVQLEKMDFFGGWHGSEFFLDVVVFLFLYFMLWIYIVFKVT